MSTLTVAMVIAAALGAAVIGGIFFAFSNFVMKALAGLPAPAGIAAMQSINVFVLNRGFLGTFAGTAVVCLALAAIAVVNWQDPASPWLLGGSVAYVVGSWMVTIAGNVPLNKTLADVKHDQADSAEVWAHYLSRWTQLNTQRASASVCAALLFCIGLLR